MASPFDPAPSPAPVQAPPPSGPDDMGGAPPDLASGWRNWVSKPDNRAALMQFGVAMLQPIGLGEDSIGHFANAVGAAGGAAGRVQETGRKEQELESKQDLRAAQAQAAEARASAAGERTNTAAARLGLAEKTLDYRQQLGNLSQAIKTQNAYQAYRAQVDKSNLIKGPNEQETPLSFEEFGARMGMQTQGVPPTVIERIRQGLQSDDPATKQQAIQDAATLRKRGITL